MALMLSSSTGLAGTTYSSLIPASLDMVPVYMKKKLLQIIERKLVFEMLSDKEDLPAGNGKVVRWIRYEKLGLPLAPLVEGVTPTVLRELATAAVEAVVDQWGDVLGVSDVADLTLFHKALQIGIERMADQAAETIDREIQRVLLQSTTNLVFPQALTQDSRDDLTSTDFITTDVLRRVVADMRDRGVPDFDGDYIGVCDPFVEQDITRDATYITAATQQNLKPLFGGRINPPRWMGIRWMVSNHMPTYARDTSAVTTPVVAFVSVGKDGSETALATLATHTVQVVGVNPAGFETHIALVSAAINNPATQIIQGTLAAASANVVAFNIYWSSTATGQKLIGQGIAPGSVVRISGNGVTITAGATGIAAVTTGQAAPVIPAVGVNVHQTYVIGREAFGTVKLTNLETMLTPNTASDSDPLKQRRKASWKLLFKAVVKNPNYYRRIESDSAYGANSASFGILS